MSTSVNDSKVNDSKCDVLIIGAGIIGLTCAYELSNRGAKVIVIDKSEPGLGCSYGNAGWLTPCFSMPLPMPGMLLKSMMWLINPVSPLYIKPEPSLLLFRWLCRFLGSMRTQTAHRSIAALTEISKYSLEEYAKLAKLGDGSFGFESKGLLMVGQTDPGMLNIIEEMHLVGTHGVPGELLKEAEIRVIEPALVKPFKGGVYFPKEAHCEPLEAARAFARAAEKNGVQIIPSAEVFDFYCSDQKIRGVRTTRGDFHADQYVLATGSWSNSLTRKLKLNLPIMGGKGYAITIKSFNPSPKIPIMILEKKVAVTPRKGSVRLAGTLELVNQDYSISSKRVDTIIQGSRSFLNVPESPEIIEVWRGLRPCTPDGVPVIGFSKYYSNLFISAGHQMLGLQSAPGSARLAADLILGVQSHFDPAPFKASRF